jgi:hypothetical protein
MGCVRDGPIFVSCVSFYPAFFVVGRSSYRRRDTMTSHPTNIFRTSLDAAGVSTQNCKRSRTATASCESFKVLSWTRHNTAQSIFDSTLKKKKEKEKKTDRFRTPPYERILSNIPCLSFHSYLTEVHPCMHTTRDSKIQ